MDQAIDALLLSTVVIGLFMLGTRAMASTIRATALQGAVLAALPLLIAGRIEPHGVALALGTIAFKVLAIPRLLFAAMRRAGVRREVEPLIGFGASLLAAGALIAVSFALGQQLRPPGSHVSALLVPCGFSGVLIGLLILVTRTKALSQVVGWVVMENGIFLFGLTVVREMPLLIEMGILLDLVVGVFIMGIVIHHISRTFDHIDTHEMTVLRD